MALTNAEKQARYRAKAKEMNEQRLNLYVDNDTKAILERLAVHLKSTKRDLLKSILFKVQMEILNEMDSNTQNEFFKIDDSLAEKRTAAFERKNSKKKNETPRKKKKTKVRKEENLTLDF
jgi:gluconate kinase